MRLRLGLLVVILLFANRALAYEGAGIERQEDAPPPPKQPTLTKAPTVKKPVEAVYPLELLAQGGPGGAVKLVIEIDATGHVPNATVSQSSGIPALDQAALTAIKQFEFTPAELDGKPAAIRLEYGFKFDPRPPPPPPPVAPDVPPPPPPVNLKGQVLERGTREPLPYATVSIPEAKLSVDSDAKGEFEVRGVPVGFVKIVVGATGHRKFETKEEIKAGQVTVLTAYLWKDLDSAHTTRVVAEQEKKDVAHVTLQHDELNTVPGSFGDPIRVLQDLPGMLRAPYISGALLVRGAEPQDTNVMVDGVPIPLLFHFLGGPSVLNPSFIDHVDFYPGAYGARYGNAIAGIVDVDTKPPAPKGIHGEVGIDLLQSNFYLEGPVSADHEWGTWAAAFRRSYIDLLLPSILNAVRSPGDASYAVAPKYYDYQARYDVVVGKNRLEFEVFGSNDSLSVAESGTAETQGFTVNTQQGFNRVRFKWSRLLDNGWSVFIAPSGGNTTQNADFNNAINGSLSSIDFNVRGAIAKKFSEKLKFESGIDLNASFFTVSFQLPALANYNTFPGENPVLPTTNTTGNTHVSSHALYAEFVWSPWRGLKIIPGVRLELFQQPVQTFTELEPRLAVRYEFNSKTAVKAAWGLYHQSPQAQDLIPVYGTPSLGLERSSQSDIGFERKLTDKLSLDLQGYYNLRTQLVGFSPLVGVNYDNGGFGRAYGIEVLIKQELTQRMYGWIAYTLQRSEQWDPTAHAFEPIIFDQTHILTIIWSYKFDSGIQLGTRFRLTTGEPTTPVIGSTFDSDTNKYTGLYGPVDSARGPTFNQLDIRVEKAWTFEKWRFSTYLDVQNVYNAQNPELTLYDYRYRESAPLRGLPFLPTLGMTGAF